MLAIQGAAHKVYEEKREAADVTPARPPRSVLAVRETETSFYLRCFLCLQAGDIPPMTTTKVVPIETVAVTADDRREPAMGGNTVR
jgi:hypothetical protein